MTNTDVLVEERAGVIHVTLNRPDRRNALSDTVLDRLLEVTAELRPGVRAIVIRGAGGMFCAGGDIKQFQSALQGAPAEEIAAYNRRYGTILEALDVAPAPVIAVVEGAAMGGGMGLASVADVTIASADTQFALTETKLGLIPAQICAFVVQRIGEHQSRRLMLTASRFGAVEALRIGLADVVSDDVDAALQEVLSEIAVCAPGANAMTKRLVADAVSERRRTEVLDRAAALFAESMLADEAHEGVRSFTERRTPPWAKATL